MLPRVVLPTGQAIVCVLLTGYGAAEFQFEQLLREPCNGGRL